VKSDGLIQGTNPLYSVAVDIEVVPHDPEAGMQHQRTVSRATNDTTCTRGSFLAGVFQRRPRSLPTVCLLRTGKYQRSRLSCVRYSSGTLLGSIIEKFLTTANATAACRRESVVSLDSASGKLTCAKRGIYVWEYMHARTHAKTRVYANESTHGIEAFHVWEYMHACMHSQTRSHKHKNQ